MKCPNCGNELRDNQKFCTYCGEEINATPMENEFNSQFPKNIIIFISLCLIGIVVIFSILYFTNRSLDINIPNKDEISNFNIQKAKNCEHEDVKNLVLDIYKENDYYYKYIDAFSIDSITLRSPVATSYDSEIDKYSCKGVITLKSTNGFKPKLYEYSNEFYDLVHTYHTIDDGVPVIRKAIQIECPVTYTSQISEGNTTVYSSTCGSTSSWSDTNNKVTWDTYDEYIEIPGEREKIRQEQQKQRQEEERRQQEAQRRQQEELKKQQEELKKQQEEQERYNNSPEGRYNNAQEDLF